MIGWIITGILLAIVVIVIIFGLSRSQAQRKVGFAEGIDSEAVGKAFNALQNLPQFKLLRKIIVKHIARPKLGDGLSAGATLLDLGCGTGHLLKALKDTIATKKLVDLNLNGIDLGSESVRFCRETLAKAGHTNIDVREGDGANMPYLNESMDVVVSSLSLHHWTDPVSVFNEIFRVLRPNGFFVLFDMRRDCRRSWHWLLRFATRVVVPKALRNVGEPLGSLLAAYTKAELQGIIARTSWANKENNIDSVLFAQVLELRK
ncbi:MAG: putative methyltransferase [Promethearchaeota archaeon CR_4]|nr:MAG: putative methyltransferase [Candidatus Lokiarchaeota archaeon CR_4]